MKSYSIFCKLYFVNPSNVWFPLISVFVPPHADIPRPNGPSEDWQSDRSSDPDPESEPEMEMAEFVSESGMSGE
jgi:hypothetical protein